MDFEEIIKYLPKITPLLLVVGLLIGIIRFRFLNGIHRSLLLYFLLMLIIDLAGRILKAYFGMNLILFPIYSLVEMCFFIYFYKRHFLKSANLFISLLGISGALFIFGEILYYFVFNEFNPKQFQPYSKVVDNFVVILIVMRFLYEKINKFQETKWDNFPLNIVVLAYFTLNLIFLLPFNFLVNESTGIKFYFLYTNIVLMVVFYIYLICSVWKNGRLQHLSFKNKNSR